MYKSCPEYIRVIVLKSVFKIKEKAIAIVLEDHSIFA